MRLVLVSFSFFMASSIDARLTLRLGAMGTRENAMAVIDSQARVYGVRGLRVVDASSFPFLPPGHPQSVICKYSSESCA